MKKVVSVFLAVLCLLLCMVPSASALSKKAGLNALQNLFEDGKGSYFDYVFYSPVKSDYDTTKYPLIVWLHGQFSGEYPRKQLYNCDIALWAADENQAKIKGTQGAFILLPRDPLIDIANGFAWNGEMKDLKHCIDEFIEIYGDNIDTNRIYLGGFSMGGKGAIQLAAAYPDFFAALFPLSPTYDATSAELRALKDMPVWLTSCRTDVLISHSTIQTNWNYLNQYATKPHLNRWSLFTVLYHSNGNLIVNPVYITHDTWNAVCADLYMDDGTLFKGMTTVNGNGYTAVNKGMLDWLSSQGYDENSNQNGSLFPTIANIFQRIIALFRRMIEIIMG